MARGSVKYGSPAGGGGGGPKMPVAKRGGIKTSKPAYASKGTAKGKSS